MINKNYYTYYPSPIGILKIKFNNQALLRIEFDDQLKEVKNNCQENFYEDPKLLRIYNLIFDQLNQYFLGDRNNFELPIQLNGNDFELKVWQKIKEIPYGMAHSYAEIASKIQKPLANAKSVAAANNKNPIFIIIPSHRVVNNDGDLDENAVGVWRKRWLLEHENNKNKKIERKISFV